MTPCEPRRLQIRSTRDLLAAVPYLLGFHPVDSMAILAMNGSRITFAMRADLLPRSATHHEVRALAEHLATAVWQQEAITSVTLVGYGPPEKVTPTIDAARQVFSAGETPIGDALRVTDGRYFSYICGNPDCCPPEGVAFDPSTSAVAAAATVAGFVALPTRTDLARQVAPVDGPARDGMRDATVRAFDRLTVRADTPSSPNEPQLPALLLRQGRTAVRRALHRHQRGSLLTDDELAWLTVVLQHVPVRDFAWRRVGGQHSHLALWMDVTRRAEPALVPAPASLLAFTAWQHGNGALAMLALDRALEADPSYSMALLLAEALHRCISPAELGTWPPPPACR